MNVLNGGEDDKLVKADDVERLKLLCELFDYSRKLIRRCRIWHCLTMQ